jgi:hypothetical protein
LPEKRPNLPPIRGNGRGQTATFGLKALLVHDR